MYIKILELVFIVDSYLFSDELNLYLNTEFRIIALKTNLAWTECARSEVLPAVLDTEMGVDVLEWYLVLMGVLVNKDFGPFHGVLNVWEFGAPWSSILKGLSNAIVPPANVFVTEGGVSMTNNILRPVTNGKSTELNAKLPLISGILDGMILLFVGELLVLVLFNPLIKVAWNGWEVVESWLVDSILVLASDHEWCALFLRGISVQVHASAWLHSSRQWLLDLLCEFWHMAAFNNLEFEIDIRMEWNWFATDWSPGEGAAVDVV